MKIDNINNSLADILSHFSQSRVLVVGDLMLDRFVSGVVERISPESPVPVLTIKREDSMPGGAGNALANLVGLGVKAQVIGLIGDDDAGMLLSTRLATLGADPALLLVDPARPSIVKTRYLAGHQQLLRADQEKNIPLRDDQVSILLSRMDQHIDTVRAVLLSDYSKGLLRPDMVKAMIARAQKAGIPVLIDPKGTDYSHYRGADLITPNRKELEQATGGMETDSDEAVTRAAQHLMTTHGIKAVLATRASDGLSLIQSAQPPLHVRSRDIEVYDVSGAGDAVIATATAVLAAGGCLEQAAQLANLAGSIVVTKVGTAPIRAEELQSALAHQEAYSQHSQSGHMAPVMEWQEAAEQARRWRARGLRIGFTNGCFDILHKGHVAYLNQARAACDRLIVAVNNDSSVRILKGEGRPVNDQNARAEVLAALGAVDMVVCFGAEKPEADNTASDLIALLQPDLYFKGGDYTEDQIPEAPAVRKAGGRIHIMDHQEGHSTTQTIARMRS
ncbi:MAG: D-glycero-beta-D-manno-heptose-7-phosphate kinase [Alphaproteobacteria bacterium]|nr:D-glycero-beta-D-manno-heptose-7-phosphate kinase [Alphaproteobacteria bacterium]